MSRKFTKVKLVWLISVICADINIESAGVSLLCFWARIMDRSQPSDESSAAAAIGNRNVPPAAMRSGLRLGVSIETKVFIALLGMVIIMYALAAVASSYAIATVAAEHRISRDNKTLGALAGLLSALQNAETGQRGYIITGQNSYLQPYTAGTTAVHIDMTHLQQLLPPTAENQRLLDQITALCTDKLAELKSTIAQRKALGFAVAQKSVLTNVGKADMDRLRGKIATLRAGETGSLAAEDRLARRRRTLTELLAGIFVLTVTLVVFAGYRLLVHDLREKRVLSGKLKDQSSRDLLTGLPNRALFFEWLRFHMARLRREGGMAALLVVNLDNFRALNQRRGAATGDIVLKTVAERIHNCIRTDQLAARLDSDDFAVLLPDVADTLDSAQVAGQIIDSISQPIPIRDALVQVGASIGIGLYPGDGREPDVLLAAAVEAMQTAKRLGRHRFVFNQDSLNDGIPRTTRLSGDLRQALDRGEFFLCYQPIVHSRSNKPLVMEALIRWRHPEFGILPPLEFIPLIEKSGLIVPIGAWVMKQACGQLSQWRRTGFDVRMAVNVSAVQCGNLNLCDVVDSEISTAGIDPDMLEIELTESILMEDQAEPVLRRLSSMGTRLAVDDFGTGFASLSYLRRFPIHRLKIDRSFIRSITVDESDQRLVRAITKMAHDLSLTVTAEGVESADAARRLEAIGCDALQGFFFARPMEAAPCGKWIRTAFEQASFN